MIRFIIAIFFIIFFGVTAGVHLQMNHIYWFYVSCGMNLMWCLFAIMIPNNVFIDIENEPYSNDTIIYSRSGHVIKRYIIKHPE